MRLTTTLFSLCLIATLSSHSNASEPDQSRPAPVPLQATMIAPPADGQPPIARGAVNAADRTCTTDEDCTLVQISCSSCCPPPTDFDAVNKLHVKDYANMGCSTEHIRSCGVPECGLAQPEPFPEASCHQGTCTMSVHAAIPRESPKSTAPNSGK